MEAQGVASKALMPTEKQGNTQDVTTKPQVTPDPVSGGSLSSARDESPPAVQDSAEGAAVSDLAAGLPGVGTKGGDQAGSGAGKGEADDGAAMAAAVGPQALRAQSTAALAVAPSDLETTAGEPPPAGLPLTGGDGSDSITAADAAAMATETPAASTVATATTGAEATPSPPAATATAATAATVAPPTSALPAEEAATAPAAAAIAPLEAAAERPAAAEAAPPASPEPPEEAGMQEDKPVELDEVQEGPAAAVMPLRAASTAGQQDEGLEAALATITLAPPDPQTGAVIAGVMAAPDAAALPEAAAPEPAGETVDTGADGTTVVVQGGAPGVDRSADADANPASSPAGSSTAAASATTADDGGLGRSDDIDASSSPPQPAAAAAESSSLAQDGEAWTPSDVGAPDASATAHAEQGAGGALAVKDLPAATAAAGGTDAVDAPVVPSDGMAGLSYAGDRASIREAGAAELGGIPSGDEVPVSSDARGFIGAPAQGDAPAQAPAGDCPASGVTPLETSGADAAGPSPVLAPAAAATVAGSAAAVAASDAAASDNAPAGAQSSANQPSEAAATREEAAGKPAAGKGKGSSAAVEGASAAQAASKSPNSSTGASRIALLGAGAAKAAKAGDRANKPPAKAAATEAAKADAKPAKAGARPAVSPGTGSAAGQPAAAATTASQDKPGAGPEEVAAKQQNGSRSKSQPQAQPHSHSNDAQHPAKAKSYAALYSSQHSPEQPPRGRSSMPGDGPELSPQLSQESPSASIAQQPDQPAQDQQQQGGGQQGRNAPGQSAAVPLQQLQQQSEWDGACVSWESGDLMARTEAEAARLGVYVRGGGVAVAGGEGAAWEEEEESLASIMALGRRPEEDVDALLAESRIAAAQEAAEAAVAAVVAAAERGLAGACDDGAYDGGGSQAILRSHPQSSGGSGGGRMGCKEAMRQRKQEQKERKKELRRQQKRQQRQRRRALMGLDPDSDGDDIDDDISGSSSDSSFSSSSSSTSPSNCSSSRRMEIESSSGRSGSKSGSRKSSGSRSGSNSQDDDGVIRSAYSAAAAAALLAAVATDPYAANREYGDGSGGVSDRDGGSGGRIIMSAGAAAALGLGSQPLPLTALWGDDAQEAGSEEDGEYADTPAALPSSFLLTPTLHPRTSDSMTFRPLPGLEYPDSIAPTASSDASSLAHAAAFNPVSSFGGEGLRTEDGSRRGCDCDDGGIVSCDRAAGGSAGECKDGRGGEQAGADAPDEEHREWSMGGMLAGSASNADTTAAVGGDDMEQRYMAAREERSRNIAAQLAALQEESKQLQQQSMLLQQRTREISRCVGLPSPPVYSSSTSPRTSLAPQQQQPQQQQPVTSTAARVVAPAPAASSSPKREDSSSTARGSSVAMLAQSPPSAPGLRPMGREPPAAPPAAGLVAASAAAAAAAGPAPPAGTGGSSAPAPDGFLSASLRSKAAPISWALPNRNPPQLRAIPSPPNAAMRLEHAASNSSFEPMLPRWAEQVESPAVSPLLGRRQDQAPVLRPLGPAAQAAPPGAYAQQQSLPSEQQQQRKQQQMQPLIRHVAGSKSGQSADTGSGVAGRHQPAPVRSRLGAAAACVQQPQPPRRQGRQQQQQQEQQPRGQQEQFDHHQQQQWQQQLQQQQQSQPWQPPFLVQQPSYPMPPQQGLLLPPLFAASPGSNPLIAGPLPAPNQGPHLMAPRPVPQQQQPLFPSMGWSGAPFGMLPNPQLCMVQPCNNGAGPGPSAAPSGEGAVAPGRAVPAKRISGGKEASWIPKPKTSTASAAPGKPPLGPGIAYGGVASGGGDGGGLQSQWAPGMPFTGAGGMMPMMSPPYGMMPPVGSWMAAPGQAPMVGVPQPAARNSGGGSGPECKSSPGRAPKGAARLSTGIQPLHIAPDSNFPAFMAYGAPGPALGMVQPGPQGFLPLGFPGAPLGSVMALMPNGGFVPLGANSNGTGQPLDPTVAPDRSGRAPASSTQLPPVQLQHSKGKIRSAPPGSYTGGVANSAAVTGDGREAGTPGIGRGGGYMPVYSMYDNGMVVMGTATDGTGGKAGASLVNGHPGAEDRGMEGLNVNGEGVAQRASIIEQQQLDRYRDLESDLLGRLNRQQLAVAAAKRRNSHDGRPGFRLF